MRINQSVHHLTAIIGYGTQHPNWAIIMSKWTLAWKSTCLKIKHAATIFQLRHDCTKSRNRRRQSHGLYRWLRSRGWCRRVWRRTWGWIRRRPGRRIPRRRRSNILQQVPRIDQLIESASDHHVIGPVGIAPLQHHNVAIQHPNVTAANLRQSEVLYCPRGLGLKKSM